MILDKKLNGTIDQANLCLIVFESDQPDVCVHILAHATCGSASETMETIQQHGPGLVLSLDSGKRPIGVFLLSDSCSSVMRKTPTCRTCDQPNATKLEHAISPWLAAPGLGTLFVARQVLQMRIVSRENQWVHVQMFGRWISW